uniref:Uncharacterized protein n=1 Tax=Corticoviridae sp. TaxID=2832474 RepID=A0A8D9PE53_9VIRU|nr:MAG TPA: hypothetical protein [Corticoviridae sp.]
MKNSNMSTDQTAQYKELEREACALVKQYGFFMPSPVKKFLAKMALFLNWQELTKEL